MGPSPARRETVQVRGVYTPRAFLQTIPILHVIRGICFVVAYCGSLILAVTMLAGSACLSLRRPEAALIRNPALFFFAISSAFSYWTHRIALVEGRELRAEHEMDMERMRFASEEDQRRKVNELLATLLKKVDALPAESRERVLSSCVDLLRPDYQRRRASGKPA